MRLSRWFGRRQVVRATMDGNGGPLARRPLADLRLRVGVATDPGCVREVNEDAIQVVRPGSSDDVTQQGAIAVVCDGMGGHEAGEVASRLAIEAFIRCATADGRDPATHLVRCVEAANTAVYEASRREPRLAGMGTTCTGLLVRDGMAYCAHVGDSRCYLVRDRELFLMTEDHSAVMDLVHRGLLTLDEARHHPDKNVILRALGSQRQVAVASWPQPLPLRPGDAFLLCSDGLSDLVGDEELRLALLAHDAQDACDSLVAMARERGGHDNISVAILALRDEAPPVPARPTREAEAQS